MMTLADLDQKDILADTPDPEYTYNIEIRAFVLTNEFRASQDLPPLTWNQMLGDIGRGHSENMANGSVPFSHEGFNDRFHSFPFRFTHEAENVAMNAGLEDVAKAAVDGWINSPGHRKNMLGNYIYSGIGVARNTRGQWYLTQLFARGF